MKYRVVACVIFILFFGFASIIGAQTNGALVKIGDRLPDDPAWRASLYSTLETNVNLSVIHSAAFGAVGEIIPALTTAAEPEDTALFIGRLLQLADDSVRRGKNRIVITRELQRYTAEYENTKTPRTLEANKRKNLLENSRHAMQNRGRTDFLSDDPGADYIEEKEPGGYIPNLPYGN